MSDRIEQIGEDFWTIRGSFKIGGVLDIGTQAALVRLGSGGFVLLDSYTLKGRVKDEVMALTDQGSKVEAVLNLHPFHTVHCRAIHEMFPNAAHYGSDRHAKKFPDLAWQEARVNDPAVWARFAPDLEFSVPAGVDFISANENVHFSSVLAYHPKSGTIHSDDTLMVLSPPRPLRALGLPSRLSFHLTLGQALEKRAGAADDFADWARTIAARWDDAQTICAAHLSVLGPSNRSTGEQILAALARVSGTLDKHKKKYG